VWLTLVCLSLSPLLSPARAQTNGNEDVVHLLRGEKGRGRAQIRGHITDYTGTEIRIKLPTGKELKFPAADVLRIETTRTPHQLAGDDDLARRQYARALEQYAAAIQEGGESRIWVRRELTSQMIRCNRALDRWEQAGELFLALVKSDPETIYWDSIPLIWDEHTPTPNLLKQARAWLARDKSPLAQLLGASHLLTTDAAAARPVLQQLAQSDHPRIAPLAQAQLGRTTEPGITADTLAAWQSNADQLPPELRAGPLYRIALAWQTLSQDDRALWAFLQVALLYPQDRQLAPLALQHAASICRNLEQTTAAEALLGELATNYPDSAAAHEVELPKYAPVPSPIPDSTTGRPTPEERFVAALRARGMYRLARQYCRAQLDSATLTPRQRLELVIESSRAAVEEALASPPDQRSSLWSEATAPLDQFLREHPQDPRIILVQVQRALAQLAQGEADRALADNAADDPAAKELARQALRAAVDQFRQAGDHLRDLSRQQSRPSKPREDDSPDDLSETEIWSLEKQVRYQLARAWRELGQTYPRRSPERSDAMTQAGERLSVLAQADAGDPLTWPSRIDEVTCARLREDFTSAERRLATILADPQLPADVAWQARSERVRLELARGKIEAAQKLLDKQTDSLGADPLWDLARLEVLTAAAQQARRAQQTDAASRWQSAALQALDQIGTRHGSAWLRRAELMVARETVQSPGAAGSAGLLAAADSFARAEKWPEALAAYDRAGTEARQRGDNATAFDALFRAAAVVHRQQQRQEARDRFRQLAMEFWEHDKAPAAHLSAIFNAAHLARDDQVDTAQPDGAQPENARIYRELLAEHLRVWPDHDTAGEAAFQLARLDERDQHWPDAAEAYSQVPPGHPRFTTAVAATARVYHHWLDAPDPSNQTPAQLMQLSRRQIQRWFAGTQNGKGPWPEKWNDSLRAAALAAAEIWLSLGRGGVSDAASILSAALADPSTPDDWRRQAEPLLFVARAAEGTSTGTSNSAPDIELTTDQRLELLERLTGILVDSSPELRGSIAHAMLTLAQPLTDAAAEMPTPQRIRYVRAMAQALAATGDFDRALAQYDSLTDQTPELLEERIQLLIAQGSPTALQRAAKECASLERRIRPGTPRWFRLRLELAQLLVRLDRKAQAQQLIRATQISYPDLGGAPYQAQFQALLNAQQ
jgi:TolA-binding protein